MDDFIHKSANDTKIRNEKSLQKFDTKIDTRNRLKNQNKIRHKKLLKNINE